MKAKSTTRGALIILTITLLSLPGFSQVMIEGGHFGVRISNRDGRIVIPTPSSRYGQTIISNRAVSSPANLGIRTNSPARTPNISYPEQIRPRTAIPYNGTVRSTTPPPRVQHVVDVKTLQHIQKLERELVVIKTTKTAWMEFDANSIFNPGSQTVRKSAKPLLDKVISYFCLSCGKGISVEYQFACGNDTCEMGKLRSAALINYLSGKSGLSIGHFSMPCPEPLRQATSPGQSFPGELRRPHKSVVNVRIQR